MERSKSFILIEFSILPSYQIIFVIKIHLTISRILLDINYSNEIKIIIQEGGKRPKMLCHSPKLHIESQISSLYLLLVKDFPFNIVGVAPKLIIFSEKLFLLLLEILALNHQ